MEFEITYKYYCPSGTFEGTYKVKNCTDKIHAQRKLEIYLEKKNGKGRMEVMSITDTLDFFKDIFGIK